MFIRICYSLLIAIPVCNLSKALSSKHLSRQVQSMNDREDYFVVEFIIHGAAGNLGVTRPD